MTKWLPFSMRPSVSCCEGQTHQAKCKIFSVSEPRTVWARQAWCASPSLFMPAERSATQKTAYSFTTANSMRPGGLGATGRVRELQQRLDTKQHRVRASLCGSTLSTKERGDVNAVYSHA